MKSSVKSSVKAMYDRWMKKLGNENAVMMLCKKVVKEILENYYGHPISDNEYESHLQNYEVNIRPHVRWDENGNLHEDKVF